VHGDVPMAKAAEWRTVLEVAVPVNVDWSLDTTNSA